MRILLPALLALLVAAPLAAADHGGRIPHLDRGEYAVGPCFAGWSVYWPGDNAWAGCAAAGHELFFVSYGSASLGHTCRVRAVDGAVSYACPNEHGILRDLLP